MFSRQAITLFDTRSSKNKTLHEQKKKVLSNPFTQCTGSPTTSKTKFCSESKSGMDRTNLASKTISILRKKVVERNPIGL